MKTIAVLGEGAWGTAIATLLAHNGFAINLWCYDEAVKIDIEKNRINKHYLPGIELEKTINPTTNLAEALNQSAVELIFQAVPVKFLRSVVEQAKLHLHEKQSWISLSKGIEQKTLLLPSDVINDVLGNHACKTAIAGPSFAHELARQQITAFEIATTNPLLGKELKSILNTHYVCSAITSDLIGTQTASALKNVMALIVGLLDGAGYKDNTRAFVLTQGLHEISLLIQLFGGNKDTAYGLAGIGDLVLTALGNLSKNRTIGYQLGQGKTIEQIIDHTQSTPEGINTLQSIHQWLHHHPINAPLPLFKGIYNVIFEGKKLSNLLQEIMHYY